MVLFLMGLKQANIEMNHPVQVRARSSNRGDCLVAYLCCCEPLRSPVARDGMRRALAGPREVL